MPSSTIDISVTHLGDLKVGYRLSSPNNVIDSSKPTLVCINSMCMTTDLFDPQFNDTRLTSAVNLLAIEPLGHGSTSFPTKAAHFTYWDTAIVALEVMSKLGVEKAFVLGTSQGGWMIVRMALLAPERVSSIKVPNCSMATFFNCIFELLANHETQILGLIPLGTSMDAETTESQSKGCWNPVPLLQPFVDSWSSDTPTPDYIVDDAWCEMVAKFGFGSHATDASTAFWTSILKEVYSGDEGRRKARMAVMCLLGRDSLCLRLKDVKCPVYWLQGTEDAPYGAQVQYEQIELFTGSKEAKLSIVDGGAHYLNATNPNEVNEAVLAMVSKYA